MAEPRDRSAIHTPDQRLRVFVSSTLAELADERAAVARAISALRLTPVMFELGARPHPPQELYRAYLAQSDIFIGLYWQRYGWVGPGMDISGLEDELRLSDRLPRLLYIKNPAPEREAQLTDMLAEIEARGTDSYRKFTSTRELARLVRDDLALLLSERFAMTSGSDRGASSSEPHAVAPAPRSIPVPATSLIGRESDIAAVTGLLEQPGAGLVTLTGPGGIGKTRLAIAVADAFDAEAEIRPLFVPLASDTQPEQALFSIAAAAGAAIEGNRPPLEVLIEHLSATPTLLILDNLEQVTGVAPDLDQLLSFCPGLKILGTSRTVLRLRAEREYVVAPLELPERSEHLSIEQLAVVPGVALFIDRARAVRHDFTLTEGNVMAVVEICRRLDGLPLAIELAAARTRLLEPAALLARLEHVLDGLGTGPIDLPERQRTLRATVEWSVDLLDDLQRRLLSTLSVFADGWTIAAAATVSGGTEDDTLDLLDALAGHSLVSVDAGGATPRFRMLTAVRELAAELLTDTGDRASVEERHAAYFAKLVEGDDSPAGGQTEWGDRLLTEEQNVRGAIRWFFTHDVAPLPHLFRELWLFWQMNDRMPEGRAWIDELRLRLDQLDNRARAEVLFTWAVTACAVGDDDSALAAMHSMEELHAVVDDSSLANGLYVAMAWMLPIVDDLDGALRAASMALQGYRQHNEPFMALAVLTVGMLEMAQGRDDLARPRLLEVEQMGDLFQNAWLSSTARTQLATIAVRAGRFDEAHDLLVATVESIEGTNVSTLTATFALVAYAQLALAVRDARQAAIALGAVDELRRRTGLLAWPITRRGEEELAERLAQRADPAVIADGRAIGATLDRQDALALVRNCTWADTSMGAAPRSPDGSARRT